MTMVPVMEKFVQMVYAMTVVVRFLSVPLNAQNLIATTSTWLVWLASFVSN